MTTGLVDAELGVVLPTAAPSSLRTTSARLVDLGEHLLSISRGVARLLPVAGWSGVAAAACDTRLLDVAAALSAEKARVDRAAEALRDAAARLRVADELAHEAHRLLATAHDVQAAADAADPALAAARLSGQWSGARDDGSLYDPHAVALLRRARDRASEARSTADAATRRLTAELTDLSGRRILRDTGSWRTVLDIVGFVPGYGDAIDLANAAVYAVQGQFREAAVTGAATVPGPLGWMAGAHKVDRALDAVGDVTRVVDESPQNIAVKALAAVATPGRTPWTRLLPDDGAVDNFYREVLAPLGETTSRSTDSGLVTVTHLPGGGKIVHRTYSRSGGHAIELQDVEGAVIRLLHTSSGWAELPYPEQVRRLSAHLVDALSDDWVSIPSMPTIAAAVSGTWDRRVNRGLIKAALLSLVDHPQVKVVNGDMTHAFTHKAELERHLDAEWPDNGEPIENDIGWLVDRDFDVSQSPMRPV